MNYNLNIEDFPQIVRDFASYKTVIQGCSEKTVSEYLFDLRTFFRFLLSRDMGISPESDEFLKIDISKIDIEYIRGISTEDIYEFLLYTGTVRKNMWSAKSRKLSAIKMFYKFVVNKRNLIEVNPTTNIESPKPRRSLPKHMSLEECLLFLEAIKNDTESEHRVRDYAIITLFLNCGMRLSELVGINISDLDRELRTVRVVGKGTKERMIYLNEACRSALSEHLAERTSEKYKTCTTKALFLSNRNTRISNKTVQHIVYKYLKLAGLESKHYSTHKLRHTAATLMYQSGQVDIRVLKDILGHEQLNTTQIYTHVSSDSMAQAMDQNPLANIGAKQDKK